MLVREPRTDNLMTALRTTSGSPVPQSGQEVSDIYVVEAGYLHHCETIIGKGYAAATAQHFILRSPGS